MLHFIGCGRDFITIFGNMHHDPMQVIHKPVKCFAHLSDFIACGNINAGSEVAF